MAAVTSLLHRSMPAIMSDTCVIRVRAAIALRIAFGAGLESVVSGMDAGGSFLDQPCGLLQDRLVRDFMNLHLQDSDHLPTGQSGHLLMQA